jgi:choline dehydrogenase
VQAIESRRVVLCAGATATPGILLRSGIGPRRSVERLGVDVVMDLPAVGARLLDHPGVAIFLWPRRGLHQSMRDPLIQTVLRYTSKRSALKNDMILQPGSLVPLPFLSRPLPLVSIMCSVGKPRGHGTIEYTSADPRSQPRIESRLLVDDEDRRRAVEAMRLAADVATSAPLRGQASFFWPPGRVVASDARLAAWIGRLCDSGYHPCGSVPMGADDARDDVAATDGRGRVRGIEGLWVADASLMPTIPSANTNLTTIMMGERFGEWMKTGEM